MQKQLLTIYIPQSSDYGARARPHTESDFLQPGAYITCTQRSGVTFLFLLQGLQTGSERVPQSHLFYFPSSADTRSVFPACL